MIVPNNQNWLLFESSSDDLGQVTRGWRTAGFHNFISNWQSLQSLGFCKIWWIIHRAFEFPRLSVIGNVDSPWSGLWTGYVSFLSPTSRQLHFYFIEKTLTLVTPFQGILSTLWTRSRNWKQNKVGEKPNDREYPLSFTFYCDEDLLDESLLLVEIVLALSHPGGISDDVVHGVRGCHQSRLQVWIILRRE